MAIMIDKVTSINNLKNDLSNSFVTKKEFESFIRKESHIVKILKRDKWRDASKRRR